LENEKIIHYPIFIIFGITKVCSMTKEKALTELQKIFRSVFINPELVISYNTSIDDIEAWDSLTHVVLIDTIEKHFQIQFDLQDMLDIEKVDDICDKIVAKSEK
jgi:acyl carrier protein